MSFLRSLFGSKKPKKTLAIAEPGKMFGWKAGTWIEAIDTTTFRLPGQLIGEGEKIGDIIEFSSDDVQIGFKQTPDQKSVTEILIKLETGQSVTIRRSAQAMIVAEDQRERKIYLTLPEDKT